MLHFQQQQQQQQQILSNIFLLVVRVNWITFKNGFVLISHVLNEQETGCNCLKSIEYIWEFSTLYLN